MGGLMSVTGTDEPTKVGVALVDVLTGLHATVGILAALRAREADGRGQRIEVSLLTALQSGLVNQASAFLGAGVVPGRLGNEHPSIAPYAVFRAADRSLALAVGNDTQFARLMDVLGDPALARDKRFSTNPERVRHRDALRREVEARLAAATAAEWSRRLTEAGVPAGPINDIAQGFALAEHLGLEPVASVADPRRDGPVATVAHPVRYSRTPVHYRSAPPRLDEDRAEVLALIDGRTP
jgi:crotonobetainyl-CoA:carnitine CoA-transferase CaiB-like acyl-CoA transferase